MSLAEIGAYALTYVAGVFTKVLADEVSERRKRGRQRTEVDARFAQVETAMPALLKELRGDFDGDSIVREFVTLPSHHNVFNHGHTIRFEYYDEAHDNLPGKIAMLENLGYIRDVGTGNHPIWRMSEEFVRLLTRV
jgi:hypothetical protein